MTDYCERCDDLGITRRVTDEIWCNVHYQIWLMESTDGDRAENPADQPEYERLLQKIERRRQMYT